MEQTLSTIQSMHTDFTEKFMVAGCKDAIVRIFAVPNMDLLTELTGHSGIVTKAVFVGLGDLIVSSDFCGKIIVWKLEGGVFVNKATKSVADGPVYDIAVRTAGGCITVFCACDNGLLKTVEFDSSLKATESEKEVHRYGVLSVSCNENFVATGGLDCRVALISGEDIEYIKNHGSAVNAVALAPSDDEKHTVLASCSEDGLLVFAFKSEEGIRTQAVMLDGPGYSLDWSRTGFVLTVGFGKDGFKSYAQNENGEYEEVPMEKTE